MFCDGSAREILGMLEEQCRAAHVETFTNIEVSEVRQPAEFGVIAAAPAVTASPVRTTVWIGGPVRPARAWCRRRLLRGATDGRYRTQAAEQAPDLQIAIERAHEILGDSVRAATSTR